MADPPHLAAGRWAEDQAAAHLAAHGLELVERNFRCRLGEIDLIMTDGHELVFVEVRYRRNPDFGDGVESVTRAKQRKLLAAAKAYVARHARTAACCRFDVVSVSKRNYRPDLLWLKDAFGQD